MALTVDALLLSRWFVLLARFPSSFPWTVLGALRFLVGGYPLPPPSDFQTSGGATSPPRAFEGDSALHLTACVWAGVRMPCKGLFPLAVLMTLVLPLPC